MNLQSMDTAQLMRHAYVQQDEMVTSDLERELLRRLDKAERELAQVEGFLDLVDEYDVTCEEIRLVLESHPASCIQLSELLQELNDHDIQTRKDLKKIIEQVLEFRSLAEDAGDVFTRLSALTKDLQEN